MISLRVDVHLCPAVPTAPNTAPTSDISRSASLDIMIALFPPSSNKLRPKRAPTAAPTAFPIRVDPVADNSAIRLSWLISAPMLRSPRIKHEVPSGTSLASNTFWIIC